MTLCLQHSKVNVRQLTVIDCFRISIKPNVSDMLKLNNLIGLLQFCMFQTTFVDNRVHTAHLYIWHFHFLNLLFRIIGELRNKSLLSTLFLLEEEAEILSQ